MEFSRFLSIFVLLKLVWFCSSTWVVKFQKPTISLVTNQFQLPIWCQPSYPAVISWRSNSKSIARSFWSNIQCSCLSCHVVIVQFWFFFCWVRWEFFTEEDDIGIEIYYKKNSKKIEVIPAERIDSSLFVHEGEIVCKNLYTRKYHRTRTSVSWTVKV